MTSPEFAGPTIPRNVTARRRCGNCDVYWRGVPECWNCGGPGEFSYDVGPLAPSPAVLPGATA